MSSRRIMTYFNRLPTSYVKPGILTDVSLLSSREPDIDEFHKIITNRQPHKIQLSNEYLYDYATKYFKQRKQVSPILIVPSPKDPKQYPYISYQTSISPIYQIKTENITIEETNAKLKYVISRTPKTYKKLYVSCLTECPYAGSIDIDTTLYELCTYYHKYGIDELSLCDTCGKLDYENFQYLVSCLSYFGIPKSRIGFQFRMTVDFPYIRRYAEENGYYKWDVVDSPIHRKNRTISYDDIYPQTI
jgi:hypothetical protein